MKCPDCFEEVIVGDLNCPYCGAELEDIIDLAPEENRGYVSLVTVSDESEAYCIKDLLENHGIPAIIESYKGSGSEGYASDDDDWGEILVNRPSLDLAFAIVHNYTESAGRPVTMEEIEPDEEPEDDDQEENEEAEEEMTEV